jgi:chromosome segregation ATPase
MTDHDINRALGKLQGSLSAIQEQLSNNERHASSSRSKMYEMLKQNYDEVHALKSELQNNQRRIAILEKFVDDEVKPFVRTVTGWKSWLTGAVAVVVVLGGVAVFFITLAADVIANWLGWGDT